MSASGTVGETFRFEVEYRLRQPSTWVYALALLGVPFLLMHAIDGSSQLLNAPESIMNAAIILGGILMLATAGTFGDAAARDVGTRMYALFYTSPLRERHYVLGRFLGALAVNATLLLGVPLGLLLASVMPYMDAGKFGPVHPAAYAQTYVLLLLPNLVLAGACMFATAALLRKPLATYLGGILLYAFAMVARDLTGAATNRTVAALADPFGGAAIEAVTRFWTPVERNAQLVGWPAIVLWNRAIWLGVAALVIVVMLARFRFAQPRTAGGRRPWRRGAVVDTAPERLTPVQMAHVTHAAAPPRLFGFSARMRQTLAVAVRGWREITGTRAFLVMLVAVILFVFAAGWDVGAELFGTSTWPVTHLIAGTILSTVLGPVIAVLTAVLAGELVWRERDTGMADIADVAPIPNTVVLLGRFLALVLVLVVLQATLAAAGMMLQTLRGYDRYEPMVYAKLLFGVKLVDYILFAALAMTIHVIVNSKYVGHLLVVLYFASTVASGFVGLRHRMLVYGSDPGWIWSDLNGLGPFVEGIVWFKLYWAAWALVFAVLANLFWVRGREHGGRRRLALARQRFTAGTAGMTAVAAALVLSTGGFVFYNTNVLNAYEPEEAWLDRAAQYERQYKRFQGAPHPSLAGVTMRAELYPEQRAATVGGTFQLVNRGERPVDSLHVLLHPDVITRMVDVGAGSRLVLDDSVLHYRIYALARPLSPGDSLPMRFEIEHRPRGFGNDGVPTKVTANAVYFERDWLPALGYRPSREIADVEERRERGLPPRKTLPDAGDVEAREAGRNAELVNVETIIGTHPAHTAVTPGRLVREWQENGRRYFHYRTDAPLSFGGAILSARYTVAQSEWNGVPLRVYHHPAHDVNVDRMLHAMRASLAYYTANFGPYQFPELRVVEFPRYMAFARAHPHTITFSEGSAFLTRVDSGEVDRTFFVVAHETAHQWWGGQVIPTQTAGAAMVSETLAQYSAMMVLEATYGVSMARSFYDYNMIEYLRGRTVFTNRERPLLDVSGQKYVHYFKGAVAMYTLRERLGADAVNGALRKFLEGYAGADAPPATSRALYAELRAATPDSLQPLLADLFEHITLWDVKTDSTRAEPDASGGWRVTLHVDVSKHRADSVGRQSPMAMNDLVEIGVFADGANGAPLYLRQHRLRGGKQAITVTVPKRPGSAGVDPYRRFIERERDDNVKPVEGVGIPPRTGQ